MSANHLDPDSEPFTGSQPSVDLLANYCHHSEKMLMTVDWSHGISHVGQCFEGGVAAFRLVLSKYAIECGFDFKFVKNDSVRVTAVCTLREQKGCSWLVHGKVETCNGYFYLKRLNNLHSCGAVVCTGKNNRLNSELVCNVIGDRLRDKLLTRLTDVVFELEKEYGLNVSYHVAWLGVEKARCEVYGDYHVSFDQLRWYEDAVMHYNPGSYVNLDFEQSTGRFKRFFISFKACIDGFNHICPLLFLDGTFLKERFKGNLLAATGKDGNKGLFPLAFAIVDSETTTNWTWFLQQLTKVVSSARALTFISDRNIGLLESLPAVFPFTHHAYCLQHLQANLRDKLRWVDNRVRFGLMVKLRECVYAPTEASFQQHWKKLKGTGRSGINNFLENMPLKHWANAYFRGKRYGEMTSNAAESFNKWILDARNYPITRLVDTIRNQIMTMRAERKVLATNWNGLLCPKMESRVMEVYSTGCTWIVRQSNEDIYEVHSFPTVLVDVGKHSCSCFQWQLNGFPCAHAVVAIQSSGRDFSTFVEQFFTVDQYKATYSGYIQPIPTVDKPSFSEDDFIIYPPAIKRPPGRPKKNRIPSWGEKLSQIRCGRCGRMGSHNRKTCKEPI
ncbi:protein FAR1-RELATED SEQUENCE 4-like [Camellia sinensis]|uniref:protein FAR1-RELATED SEQUENCE 4-like n=1 Tax=Camellia sinensis TaxID=4442 RepID=UPI00103650FD|nr:protein FAR1-RELATED SEQUENCE 4-like [Camellia sinensis]